jgi:hypothetical protein
MKCFLLRVASLLILRLLKEMQRLEWLVELRVKRLVKRVLDRLKRLLHYACLLHYLRLTKSILRWRRRRRWWWWCLSLLLQCLCNVRLMLIVVVLGELRSVV